jgi:hypothetical protein
LSTQTKHRQLSKKQETRDEAERETVGEVATTVVVASEAFVLLATTFGCVVDVVDVDDGSTPSATTTVSSLVNSTAETNK